MFKNCKKKLKENIKVKPVKMQDGHNYWCFAHGSKSRRRQWKGFSSGETRVSAWTEVVYWNYSLLLLGWVTMGSTSSITDVEDTTIETRPYELVQTSSLIPSINLKGGRLTIITMSAYQSMTTWNLKERPSTMFWVSSAKMGISFLIL